MSSNPKVDIFILAIVVGCFYPAFSQTTLIPYGTPWNYSDLGQEPSSQGSLDWSDKTYNEASWPVGASQIGYGDNDEATIISDLALTAYFRYHFDVLNASSFGSLDLDLIYDDGAIVYLNGAEIWRINMPSGPATYNTFAASASTDNALATTNIGNLLVDDDNVIAVEVHQRNASSSDISFDFKLVANPAGLVNVIRGPYLQKGSGTAVTIKWRTSTATESVIRYGTSLNQLNSTASSTALKTNHEVQISGLNTNQKYYYEVANLTNTLVAASADLYFRTAPAVGARQPITAWILGDCGTGNSNARSVRDAYYNYIDQNHTDMLLFLGDNAYGSGTDSEYQFAIFENMYEEKLKNTISWSCLGNHDGASASSSSQTGPYYDIFSFPKQGECGGVPSSTEAYYSFDYGNIHFIALDSDDSNRSVGGPMYLWCQNDIQSTSADWIVAFWHHPAYTKGSHDSDSESALIQMRENFVPLLEGNGVDLVLSGHSHSYERSYFLNGHTGNSNSFNSVTHTVGANGNGDGRIDGDGAYQKTKTQTAGATYITSGSSGKTSSGSLDHEAMYYSVSALGSCVLEVDAGSMQVKFLRNTGAVEDYFTITKELDCTIGAPCDDGDMCTIDDKIGANCACLGSPIVNPPSNLTLNAGNSPLNTTYMATQSIIVNGAMTESQTLTALIAPVVTLQPTFEVMPSSEFIVMQHGCN
jgi:hypothetical protein